MTLSITLAPKRTRTGGTKITPQASASFTINPIFLNAYNFYLGLDKKTRCLSKLAKKMLLFLLNEARLSRLMFINRYAVDRLENVFSA